MSGHNTGNVCIINIYADHCHRIAQIHTNYKSNLLGQYSHVSAYIPQLEVVAIQK